MYVVVFKINSSWHGPFETEWQAEHWAMGHEYGNFAIYKLGECVQDFD